MTALAGVVAEGLGQPNYLQEGLERLPAKETSSESTSGRVPGQGMQLSALAQRADDKEHVGVRRRRPHLSLPLLTPYAEVAVLIMLLPPVASLASRWSRTGSREEPLIPDVQPRLALSQPRSLSAYLQSATPHGVLSLTIKNMIQ